MEKQFLIVVDLQNDFVDGALGTPEAQRIVPAAVEHIRRRRSEGATVLATMDTHGPEYLSTAEGRKLPVEHCIRGTHGWELNPEVEAALEGCERIEKPGFGSPRLPERVAQLSGDGENLTIEVIGLCTDICVVCNAMLLKARFPEATMRLLRSCCAGVTPELHEAALKTMASCQIEVE
jgi:nicotinamidase-related amidase